MANDDRSDADGAKRFRSPPYPQVTLGKAIERARELHQKVHRHSANVTMLATSWGIKETTGTLWTTAASLIQFGLITDEGSGDKRKFQLTDAAVRLLLDTDPSSEKRRSALQRAAIAPKIHAELWERFNAAGQVSDALLKSYLTLDRRDEGKAPYSDTAADEVIRIYRDAIAFAGLQDSASVSSSSEDKETSFSEPPIKLQRSMEADIQAPAAPSSHRDEPPASAGKGAVPLAEGERELTSGLLSRGASFRLVVSGRVGAKELERLIRKLELDKEILADPDDEPAVD